MLNGTKKVTKRSKYFRIVTETGSNSSALLAEIDAFECVLAHMDGIKQS